MHFARPSSWRHLLSAVAMAAALAACGGDGGSDDEDTPPPATGSEAGVFTDAPVNGLAYTASPSGVTGVTGDTGTDGGFSYEPGDTVTFSLAGLTLGSAEGAASVSPADVAGGDATVAANLLVLLQSLDSDADEGAIAISLPANTDLSGLALDAAPETFAAAPVFTSAVTAAGGTVVDLDAARAHAISQFWSQVAGTWVLQEEDGTVVVRITDQGHYLLGENGVADDAGQAGMEQGAITWDPTTQEATSAVSVETNGEWGLSDPIGGKYLLRYDGTNLLVRDIGDAEDDWVSLRRARNAAGALYGVWAVQLEDGQTPPLGTFTFAFSNENRYFMIDPLGDTPDENDPNDEVCGGPGVETGTFTYTASTGMLTVDTVGTDTNGCGGLHDGTLGGTGRAQLRNIAFSADGNTMTATVYTQAGDEDGSVTLVRVGP